MRRLIAQVLLLCGISLFFLCICSQYTINKKLEAYQGSSLLALEEQILPDSHFFYQYRQLLTPQKEEGAAGTFFLEKKGMNIQNKEFSRKAEVTAIEISGASVLLFPYDYPLDTDDKTGCLIDKQTAWELFGDMNVVGKEVSYQGKNYKIRGILKENQALFVCEAAKRLTGSLNIQAGGETPGLEEGFSYVILKGLEKGKEEQAAEEAAASFGIYGKKSQLYWGEFPRQGRKRSQLWEALLELIYKENNCVEIIYIQETAGFLKYIVYELVLILLFMHGGIWYVKSVCIPPEQGSSCRDK